MTTTKRSHKDNGESRRGEDDTRKDLGPEDKVTATQGEKGQLSKKTYATCKKKKSKKKKIASRIQKELN